VAEQQTPNFKWIKPDLGGDASTWGNVLNTAFDSVDSVAYANQQAGVPIGSIVMFGGPPASLPINWLFCNGSVYLDSDIPALAAILKGSSTPGYPGSDATHTAVPNMNGRFPVGADFATWTRGMTGGEANHTLLMAEMPAHAHTATQGTHTHAATMGTHAHPITDVAHSHGVNQWAHSHGVTQTPHAHNVGAHAHGSSLMRFIGGSGQPLGIGSGGNANVTYGNTDSIGSITDAQNANISGTDTQTSAISLVANGTGLSTTQAASPGAITVPSVSAGAITVTSQGSGATHNNMPPYTCVAFIIRYQ
jgi:microcystin-dependent protein